MVRPVGTKVLSSVIDGMNARRASTVDLPAVLVRDLRNNSNRQQGSQSYLSCLIVLALTVLATNALSPTLYKSLFAVEKRRPHSGGVRQPSSRRKRQCGFINTKTPGFVVSHKFAGLMPRDCEK